MDAPRDLAAQLSALPLLSGCTPDELQAVAHMARLRAFEDDEILVEAGTPADGLVLLLEGEARRIEPARSASPSVRLGPGDAVGEGALLNDLPRPATVRSVGPGVALTVPRELFQALLQARPEMAVRLLDHISRRLREEEDELGILRDQVLRDPRTGLLNRNSFHERLAQELERLARYGEPVSLILLDVDRFGALNDSLGPAAGDTVLTWVGRLVSEHTRAVDSAYRIGGEEFAVLLPSSEGEVAGTAARRLVEVVGRSRPPLDFAVRVTLSAGVASAPTDGRRPDTLFHAADRALLRAKAEGRNRVHGPSSPF